MSYRLALIGFPFSGKTTVLQAACGIGPDHLHSAGDLDQHVGTLKFADDDKLDWLTELYDSKKSTPVSFELWDFPGFDLTSEQTRHQARRLLGEVRQCDLLVVVLRAFKNPSVPAYRDRVDPGSDLEELMEEFVFADMDQLARRIEKLETQVKRPTPTRDRDRKELDLLKRCLDALEAGKAVEGLVQNTEEDTLLRGFALLTQRPCVVIINTDEDKLSETDELKPYPAIKGKFVCAAEYERQLLELGEEERRPFLDEAGITEMLAGRLIKSSFEALGLITFYTASSPETRAWAIPRGLPAIEAASKVHSDMARGFIRAETISFDELQACGSYKQARADGKLRLEGKDYIVQDGDVILFRFNV